MLQKVQFFTVLELFHNNFEILVGRNTPSIRETVAEMFGPLRQMGYVPRPCPNMARKYGIFNFSPKIVIMVLNLGLLSAIF